MVTFLVVFLVATKCSAQRYVQTPGQVLEDTAVAVQGTAPQAVYKRMERKNAEVSE